MKILNLIQAKNVFNANEEVENKKVGYKIVKFIKAIEIETEFYYKSLAKIRDKYAKRDENGNFVADQDGNIAIIPEKANDYIREMNELNDIDVPAPDIRFTIEELECVKMALGGLYILDPFIDE